jgi:hypothetical protein
MQILQLPDMDFPINSRAEGRVLVPWEHRRFPNLTLEDSSGKPRLSSMYKPRSNISSQSVSKPCLMGRSAQTGAAQATSGMLGGAPAPQTPPPGVSSLLYAAPSHIKSPITSPLPSQSPVLTSHSCPALPPLPLIFALGLMSTTTRVTFSRIGAPYPYSIPFLAQQKRKVFWILRFRATIIMVARRGILMGGIQSILS